MSRIRLVTFDVGHTIITPRLPIHVQYSQIFTPYLGVLPPASIKRSFNVALKAVQKAHPSYDKGAINWWTDVIRRTALGAGGDEHAIDVHLSDIVSQLMMQFSSREGYKAFEEAIPTIRHLNSRLGIRTAVVSNGDSRIRRVLQDLDFPGILEPIVLSEEQRVEKPSPEIFSKVLKLVNQDPNLECNPIQPRQCLHVGDELACDFIGATEAGMNALLIRREGPDGENEHKEVGENLENVEVIRRLDQVISWVQGNE